MNNNIPFVIPEKDVHLRIARFLLIIETLAYTQRGKLVLNNDKLIIFDFLVKYPYLLKQVLKLKNNNSSLKLYKEEVGSVSTLYPIKSALLDTSSAKILIKLMVSYNLILVERHENELFYTISDKGKSLINEMETDYSNRIKELCESISVFRSTNTNELKKIINPLIKGV